MKLKKINRMVSTGAKDMDEARDFVWNFTSGAEPDIIKPTVISRVPVNAAAAVPIGSKLTVTFSEAMDPATITTTTITLKEGTTDVSGTVSYSGVTAVFTPVRDLAASTVHTATISTGTTDLAGNPLESSYVWNFTTGAAAVAQRR